MFRFASPYFLAVLALIPAVLYYRRRRMAPPALRISSISAIRHLKGSLALRLHWLVPALKYAALGLMVVAMARPQWGTRQVDVLTEGVNIALAVDISESMAALDFKREAKIVNRLEAVKGVIRDFIAQRTGDRIGLIVFGSEAYTQVPLTRDYDTIISVLERVEIGAAGQNTAIGDAVGISLKRLEDIKSKSNLVILLTDGQSNTGELSPQAAAAVAAQKGVKIYTIGVGSKGEAPYLVKHPLLGERYVYQKVNIDEATLKSLAQKTGGSYFRAQDTESLRKIYDTIDRLETTRVEVKTFAEYRELYLCLLVPALGCLGLMIVLAHTRFLRVP